MTASCTGETPTDETPDPTPAGTAKVTLTVTADRGGSSDTRTVYEDTGTVNDQGGMGMNVYWNTPPATESIQAIWYVEDVATVGTMEEDPMSGEIISIVSTLTGTADAAKSRSMNFTGEGTRSTGTKMADYYHYVYPVDTRASDNFIIYSYGGQTQDCTAGNETKHLQEVDVMYTEQAVKVTPATEGTSQTPPAFGFKHASALIRFDLTLPEPNTISQITLRDTNGTPTFGTDIQLTYGTPTAEGVAPVTFSFFATSDVITLNLTNASESNTLTAYMMTPAIDFSSVDFEVRAIATDGTQYTYTGTSGADDRLEGGVCYTFGPSGGTTMTQVPEPVWAGSNIYYDNTLGTLTFAAPDATTPANVDRYQGVFFTYGSIIGVSPYYDATATGTETTFNIAKMPLFMPDPSTGEYTPTNGSYPTINGTTLTNLTGIPRLSNPYSSDYTNTITADYDNYKGDICAFLSGKAGIPEGTWRLPTAKELLNIGTSGIYSSEGEWSVTTGTSGGFAEANQTDGTAVITNYVTRNASGTNFPLSGMRLDNGTLYYVGGFGYYPASNGKQFTPNTASYLLQSDNSRFTPVRCVKEAASE
jgi:hypothetical protein